MFNTRIAVLYDESGAEIFRGNPSEMPVRFVDTQGNAVDWTMAQACDAGTPIDEITGDDLRLHDAG